MKKLVLILTAGLCVVQAKSQNLKQAVAYTDKEQFETSAQTFYKLLAAKPTDAELLYYMGENFSASERDDSAAFYYNKGLGANPSYPLNYVGKGKLAIAKGNEVEAQGLFNKAKELGPKNAEVYIRIAEAYISTKQSKYMPAAMEALATAEKLDAKNVKIPLLQGDAQLILDNDGSKAINFYDKAAALDPNSPMPNIHTGALYEKARAFDLAFNEYNNAVKKDSTFAPSYRMLGDLYYKYNKPVQATEYYEKYLKLSGNTFSARVKYAKFLFLAKDYNKAIEQMQELLKQDPSLNILNRLLAFSYFETKQYAEGLLYMEKFLENAPKGNNAIIAEDHSYYGKLLAASGSDSLATEEYKKALQIDSTMLDLYTDMANSYKKIGKPNLAVKALDTKIKRTKEPSINDYFALGQMIYAQGMASKDSVERRTYLTEADSIFGIVTEKVPTQIIAHLLRAKANVGLDPQTTIGLAKPHYEKIIELGMADVPKNKAYLLEANYYLAFLYYNQKNKAEALKYVDQTLSIEPTHEQAKKLKEIINKYLKDATPESGK